MDYFQLGLLGIASVLFLLWKWSRKPTNFPPGPIGLPVVGYLPFLGEHPHKTFNELANKYGNVFSVRLGNSDVVVLNDWKAIKEAFVNQNEIFNGRPRTIIYEEVFHTSDVTFTDGPLWKDRRRFTLHFLKDSGLGKSMMEELIMDEIQALLGRLKQHDNKELEINEYFASYFLNVIWSVVAKKRFEQDDATMSEYMQVLKDIFGKLGLSNTNPIMFLPWLRYMYHKRYQVLKNSVQKVYDFLGNTIDEHIATYQEGCPRDFIDAFLEEIYKREKLKMQSEALTRESLIQISHDMFLVGIETSNTAVVWGLLYMATWPKIQQKVHQELDEVIGRQRLPSWKDRTALKYTNAVIMEIHRYSSIVPLSVTHTNTAKTKLLGHTLPKGTAIFPNLWAVHYDPNYWKDPEVFRPERFLNENGDAVKPEYLIPFSIGGRACLGKSLAEMNNFLLLTCLLHQFSFSVVPGKPFPNLDPIYAIVVFPHPFSLLVKQH